MKTFKLIILLCIFSILFSCTKREPIPIGGNNLDSTQTINAFIYENTKTYYLWEDQIPVGIDYLSYADPYQLFDDIVYTPLDHWSFVTDDYQEILNALNGTSKTSGFNLKLFQKENSNEVFGIIEYVYKDGPADIAGLKRGDYLLKIDNQTLNIDNYSSLLGNDVYDITIGELVIDQIVETTTVTITNVEMSINPVLQYEVFEIAGNKIGYLLYDQFIEDYFAELEAVFIDFKTQGINELILDFRYNPGGYITTCKKLASMIAPASAIGDVFLTMQWNQLLTASFTQSYGPESDAFIEYFPATNVNLNLSGVLVLTSSRTASASEAIINGLKPYMNVHIIGEQTAGKYTGASLLSDIQERHNWAIFLVLNKIANADGVTDYIDGFVPNNIVQDDYTTPIGDLNEVLLSRAIAYITGVTKKVTNKTIKNKPIGNYYKSKFEKEGLLINDKIK